MEISIEYIIYDPVDDTLMGRGDSGWIDASTGLLKCKRWLRQENAERHCYLDRMQVLAVEVTKTVEVKVVEQ